MIYSAFTDSMSDRVNHAFSASAQRTPLPSCSAMQIFFSFYENQIESNTKYSLRLPDYSIKRKLDKLSARTGGQLAARVTLERSLVVDRSLA